MSAPTMFRLPLSQVEGRLDPHFYQLSYRKLTEEICQKPHKKLRELCRFSTEIWNGVNEFQGEFPYLEISDIDLSSGQFDTPKNIPISEAPSRARMKVRHGDILVSLTRPSRGAITRSSKEHPPLFIASTGFAVLREVSTNDAHPDYLFHALRSRIALSQFEQRSSGGNYPAITEEEMGRVLIPLPDEKTQKHIATLMRNAYAQKATLEAQAKTLLDSVDAVLYRHLGMEPPAPKANGLNDRVFKVRLDEVRSRFDPHFYQSSHQSLVGKVRAISHQQLCTLCRFSKEIWDGCSDFQTEFPYLEISDIELSSGLFGELKRILKKESPSRARMKVRHGDFLVSLTRPTRGAITRSTSDHPELFIASTGFAVLRDLVTTSIEPDYFFYALRSAIVLNQFEQRSSGGNYPAITEEEMGRVLIPLPSKKIQQLIINEISHLHTQAQSLRQQAQDVLEQAKRQTEALILGADAHD